ncbi:MAG: MerR family transcriptional regulator [Ornithinimicrobium sp.]
MERESGSGVRWEVFDRQPTLSENATGRSEGNDVKISELAKRSGVSVRSLRYYEEQGLLSPQRDASSHRRFETSDVNRVIVIQELYAAGFCSTVVRELLPGVLNPAGRDLAGVGAHFDAARCRLQREARDIKQEIDVLAQVQTRLGLAPHTHVRGDADQHDDEDTTVPAPADNRDRRLR